jgi:K+-sensing histidine kinase KdpD
MVEDSIAAASHDLLSPINLIRGYAVTLSQMGEKLTESQKQRYLRAIETAAMRATRSIRGFLDLPKTNAECLHLDAVPTSLGELVREVVTEMRRQSAHHVIKLRSQRNMPIITIDREKIRQVMINLLDNAIKYSPVGSDITVQIKDSENTDVAIPTSSARNLVVEVIDSGIGIPESEVELIFEKFYRVDNMLTRSTQGMGIGLHICKLIVKAHGGQIWATSRGSEHGSIFSFTLPVA